MKTLLIFMFCISFGYADDISSKVLERRAQNGSIKFRLETIYRGTAKVMMITSRPDKDGVMRVAARSYLVGGDLVMADADHDLDGTFETMAIYHPGTEDVEVFTRQPDGSIKPAEAKVLAVSKKQLAAISEFWSEAFQKETTDREVTDSVSETQKKIQDAEKEKKNDK